jgi:hypothetical protein
VILESTSFFFFFFWWRNSPDLALAALVCRLLYDTQADTPTHLVGLLWTSDQLVAEVSTYTAHKKHRRLISMPSMRLEPAIPAGEWPQTYDPDRTATEIGTLGLCYNYLRWGATSHVNKASKIYANYLKKRSVVYAIRLTLQTNRKFVFRLNACHIKYCDLTSYFVLTCALRRSLVHVRILVTRQQICYRYAEWLPASRHVTGM